MFLFFSHLPVFHFFAGSLTVSITDMRAPLVGGSGGVYALCSAHLANVVMVRIGQTAAVLWKIGDAEFASSCYFLADILRANRKRGGQKILQREGPSRGQKTETENLRCLPSQRRLFWHQHSRAAAKLNREKYTRPHSCDS